MDLQAYQTDGFWDELLDPDLRPRPGTEQIVRRLAGFSHGELAERQKAADKTLLTMGITFNVYGHEAGTEKVWPFDIVPRVIESSEWNVVERGLKQRIHALNLFIDDVYNQRRIVTDGVVPDWLVDSGKSVIVIEHHQAVMAHADWIIDLGPGAGHDGGRIVFEGTPAELVATRSTLTGEHLAAYVGE